MKNAFRFAIILGAISIAAGLAIAGVYGLTHARIERKERAAFEESLRAIFPEAERFAPVHADVLAPGAAIDSAAFLEDLRRGKAVGAAIGGEGVAGYLAVGEGQGYSSRIRVLVGAKPDGSIKAIRILYAAETPGLGERAREVKANRTLWQGLKGAFGAKPAAPAGGLEPWFPKQFENKDFGQLVVVKTASTDKIQAITAATITSTAVTNAVRAALGAISRETSGAPGPANRDVQVITSATPSASESDVRLPGVDSSATGRR